MTDPIATGATTNGGFSGGANPLIIRVKTLADSGPGSLRAAIETDGPRVVVFDVGGTLTLASDLDLRKPYITIAGQTAPTPGVNITGGSIRIRTHDVVMQHIAVRAGIGPTAAINDNRDGISIDGSPGGKYESYEIRLENVAAMWSVDEALSLWYSTTRNVTIRASIVAEALNLAGHPKGDHSMGLLLGEDTKQVAIVGNLFASNMFRNPVIGKGVSAYVANNYIYNPVQNAMHTYATGSDQPTTASIINNVVERGFNTKLTIMGLYIQANADGSPTADVIYADGNKLDLGPQSRAIVAAAGFQFAAAPVTEPADWTLLPTDQVKAWVLKYAGPRPALRDPIGARLIAQVKGGTARIINRPEDAGPLPVTAPHVNAAKVPSDPYSILPVTNKSVLETWLDAQHVKVGGAPRN